MILSDLLHSHHPLFDALASAWLSAGAQAFSVWFNNEALECWPKGSDELLSALVSPIEVEGHIAGELRTAITATPQAQERLKADSRLVAGLLPLARDLDWVTNELVETRDELLALFQLTQSCRTCVSLDKVIGELAAQINHLAKTETTFFYLSQPEKGPASAQYPEQRFTLQEMEGFLQALGKRKTAILNQDGDEILLALLSMENATVSVQRGVMGLVKKLHGQFLSPDIKLAAALADQSSVQIEKVLMMQSQLQLARMETEMELAQRVQISLLPKENPRLPGIEVWGATRPALHVGGDFFDYIQKPGWPFLFVTGDISGKGFPAALLMSMTRTIIRTALHDQSTPERILSDTNHELYDDFNRLNSFATLFIGQYMPEERQVLYANAGHSPVIYRPCDDPPRILFADGAPLGIFPYVQSRDQRLSLKEGDLLLIGSDGLSDAENDEGERFGYDRLLDLVASLGRIKPGDMASAIFQEVSSFSATRLPFDDQTLLILQCTGD